MGSGAYPVYSVICAHDGRAWVRDISSGAEAIVDAERCRRLELEEVQRVEVDLPRAAKLTPKAPNPTPDKPPD